MPPSPLWKRAVMAACLGILPPAAAAQAPSQPSPAVRTLSDAYQRALAASESVAINEQAIRQAEDLYRRAFGTSMPAFSYRTLTTWVGGSPAFATGAMSQTDAGFRVAQTNLTFYRELAAVRQAKSVVGIQEETYLRARQLLLAAVASAFYGQLQAKENVLTALQLKDLAGQRLEKLHEWVRVGRSREADALAQDSQISSLDSQREESERQVSARSDLLTYLTLAPVEPSTDDAPIADAPKPLETYLARLETRPDVKAVRNAADASEAAVRVARGDRFPQLSFFGDAYNSRPGSRMAARWDAQLTVSVPLFQWGALNAEVAFAKDGLAAQRLALQQARRQADLDIRNAYRDDLSARRQLEIQRRAVDLAERDFELQRRDEARGLVTAIDVLQSLDRLNTSRLARANALLNARLAAINLEIAAGAKPEELDLR